MMLSRAWWIVLLVACQAGTSVEVDETTQELIFHEPCAKYICVLGVPHHGICLVFPHHDGTTCDDGDACTTGTTCADAECVGGAPVTCDDTNGCTDDTCDPETGCVFANNTSACDDGDACTDATACANGACGGGTPVVCNDGNGCTDDACDPSTGCVAANNTATCDDANACTTTDTCGGGACTGGPALGCDDGNVCTDDVCDAATGCVHANNTAPCDDGNPASVGDACSGGVCVPGAVDPCPLFTSIPGQTSRYFLLGIVDGDWANQSNRCALRGGTLATPDDASELSALVTFAGGLDFWIGINDRATEGVFASQQGPLPAFLPWAPGQPDDAGTPGDEDCVGVANATAQYSDRDCATTLRAVCECAQ